MGTCSQYTLRGSGHEQSTYFLAEVGQSEIRYIEEKSFKPHNHTARAKKCSQKKQVASPRLRLIPLPLEVVGRLRRCPVFAVDNLRASTADTCGPTSVRSMCHSRRSALSKFIEICPSRWRTDHKCFKCGASTLCARLRRFSVAATSRLM